MWLVFMWIMECPPLHHKICHISRKTTQMDHKILLIRMVAPRAQRSNYYYSFQRVLLMPPCPHQSKFLSSSAIDSTVLVCVYLHLVLSLYEFLYFIFPTNREKWTYFLWCDDLNFFIKNVLIYNFVYVIVIMPKEQGFILPFWYK